MGQLEARPFRTFRVGRPWARNLEPNRLHLIGSGFRPPGSTKEQQPKGRQKGKGQEAI